MFSFPCPKGSREQKARNSFLSIAANPLNKPAPFRSSFNVSAHDQQHVLMAQVLKKSVTLSDFALHVLKVAEERRAATLFYLFFIV
jgi:hypothetical protein